MNEWLFFPVPYTSYKCVTFEKLSVKRLAKNFYQKIECSLFLITRLIILKIVRMNEKNEKNVKILSKVSV